MSKPFQILPFLLREAQKPRYVKSIVKIGGKECAFYRPYIHGTVVQENETVVGLNDYSDALKDVDETLIHYFETPDQVKLAIDLMTPADIKPSVTIAMLTSQFVSDYDGVNMSYSIRPAEPKTLKPGEPGFKFKF